MKRAPFSRAIAAVRSLLNESNTTMSSDHEQDSMQPARLTSSLSVRMRTEIAGMRGILARRDARRTRTPARWLAGWALIGCSFMTGADCQAEPPRLYRNPFYESPVSAGPDDLLLIAGYGFRSDDRVVYALDGERGGEHPAALPAVSNLASGFADVVSAADVPYSLTVRLPKTLRRDATYDLWVVTPELAWSEVLRINDPRPLWFTPAVAYETGAL